ncbi:MAG: DUF1109 domain-containing protein [Gammaproteobacteria bacterium]|nr:DUF1109 domain-containing protein [Gammaproteobacteria bacterium]MBU1440006.1 DUF1109 domain-containing protein [Gammaproteobacteria bacterium]MBU2288440.1 DUF1109 domain-containing protein [Gammaproteobacteria bacterium]
MKTDDLISLLATGAGAVPRHSASRRLAIALATALPFSFVLMVFEYGLRSDLVQTMFWPMFWVKFFFPVILAAACAVVVHRLARPGVPVRSAWLGIALPIAAVWALALVSLVNAPAGEREAMILGQTWSSCALNIVVISVPVFVGAMLALKGLAPTRPMLAGAAAGFMSGAAGAAIYALHCPETAAPFLAIWYVAGMVLVALAGALVGRFFLRW